MVCNSIFKEKSDNVAKSKNAQFTKTSIVVKLARTVTAVTASRESD